MNDLTREAILSAEDAPLEAVDVPEWGGTLYVRSMNGIERDSFDSWLVEVPADERTNQRGRIVALCACDAEGARLFTDDDINALGHKSAEALSRVADTAMRLNALSASDVEDIAEN